MNKYIIEDNLDFKAEMANYSLNNEETCLLSNESLNKTHIILPCNHRFNYIPLFNEVCKQKEYSNFDTCRLKTYQMKCPYCRTVFDKILPYIPVEKNEKKYGVNYPKKYCMDFFIKKVDNSIEWTVEMYKMYKTKKINELKNLLKLHGKKVGGNKRDLVERIFENGMQFTL
jgi:hypothetical protein